MLELTHPCPLANYKIQQACISARLVKNKEITNSQDFLAQSSLFLCSNPKANQGFTLHPIITLYDF